MTGGPMRGPWNPTLLAQLQAVRHQTSRALDAVQVGLPIPAAWWEAVAVVGEGHAYTSTACQHQRHDRCRHVCKFCEEPCRCVCHRQPVPGVYSENQGRRQAEETS